MGSIISLKTKQQVLEMFKSGLRSRKISENLDLDRSVVKEWQYLYDGGDTRWVSEKPVARATLVSQTQRAFIVNAYQMDALTMADLCRGFLLPKTVIKHWVRDYSNDTGTERNQRTKEKTQGSRRQEQNLGNLHKYLSRGGDRSSKKKILRTFVAGQKAGLSVSQMLRELRIPRTDYYRWLKNPDGKDESTLINRIQTIQEEHNFNIGSKRMSQMLKHEGIVVNHKKVDRIMSENHLHAKQKIRKHPKDYYRAKKQAAKNLPVNVLNRDFSATFPGKKLVTDITYLHTSEGWCFLSAVKDLYNKEIVAYAMSKSLNMNLVLETMNNLKNHFPSLEQSLIHSDRGWTYTNPKFVSWLKNENIIQSLSAKGDCWDNACMESFFSTLKSETIYHSDFNNISYVKMVLLVQNYIEYYNQERISKSLNWMSPVNYLKSHS